jgi:alpha-L-fucosidase
LKEQISLGQRVVKFEVSGGNNLEQFQKITEGTTIGHKRILKFPSQKLKYIRIKVTESKATPLISSIEGYNVAGI